LTERIEGKVAQVIGARQLIINRGSEHGVKVGMRFAVLDTRAADVRDPDTNEPIGSLFFEKAKVEVTVVEPKIALAETFERQQPSETDQLLGLASVFAQAQPVVMLGDTVQRGDRVREIPPPAPAKTTIKASGSS
jgi:hypothetical protein